MQTSTLVLGSFLFYVAPSLALGCSGGILPVGKDTSDDGGGPLVDASTDAPSGDDGGPTPVPNVCTTNGGTCVPVIALPDAAPTYACPAGTSGSPDTCGASGERCCLPLTPTPSACGAAGGTCVDVLGPSDGAYACPPGEQPSALSCAPGGGDCCIPAPQADAGCHTNADCTGGPDYCNVCPAPFNYGICRGGACICACQSPKCTSGGECGAGQICVEDFNPMLGPNPVNSMCLDDPCGGQPLSCACAKPSCGNSFGLSCMVESGGVLACGTGG